MGTWSKWRCAFHNSNASLAMDASDCLDRAVKMTNGYWPQQSGTTPIWQRNYLYRSKCAKPDQKGARALFEASFSALANRDFSTGSAASSHLLRSCGLFPPAPKANLLQISACHGSIYRFRFSIVLDGRPPRHQVIRPFLIQKWHPHSFF